MKERIHSVEPVFIENISVVILPKQITRLRLHLSKEGIVCSVPVGIERSRVMEFLESNRAWLRRTYDIFQQTIKESLSIDSRIDSYLPLLRERIHHWEARMGLHARYTIREMSTRWGSCTPARRTIRLNSRLCLYPLECTDYVVVHELSHLVHHGHTPAFWAHVEQYLPDWRKYRAMLKKPAEI